MNPFGRWKCACLYLDYQRCGWTYLDCYVEQFWSCNTCSHLYLSRMQNGACLVHCQRGISRSASVVRKIASFASIIPTFPIHTFPLFTYSECAGIKTKSVFQVISFMMKENNWTLEEALEYVKKHRDCIRPNDGFLQQLKTYEGILQARYFLSKFHMSCSH